MQYKLDNLFPTQKHKDIFIYLILNNIPASTGLFFIKSLDKLEQEGDLSATEMGRLSMMTTGAALYHLRLLSNIHPVPKKETTKRNRYVVDENDKNIIRRVGYRRWELNSEIYEAIVKPKESLNTPRTSYKY